MDLKNKIRSYKNFPKKGIIFRDYSEILENSATTKYMVDEISKSFHQNDVDIFAGIESRGFPIACALSLKYNKGMIMIRKKGKIPGKKISINYKTEYSKSILEIQKNEIIKNKKIIICDDLLATGGTANAASKLIEKVHGIISGFAFIIELTDLNGRDTINKYKCISLVQY